MIGAGEHGAELPGGPVDQVLLKNLSLGAILGTREGGTALQKEDRIVGRVHSTEVLVPVSSPDSDRLAAVRIGEPHARQAISRKGHVYDPGSVRRRSDESIP